LFLSSCSQNQNKPDSSTTQTTPVEEGAEHNEKDETAIVNKADLYGIWGDESYLDNLKKYNSVSKARELIAFDTDIKIYKNMILGDRPNYMEPQEFDDQLYSILLKDSTLVVTNKKEGNAQAYRMLISIPEDTESLWELFSRDYSAISKMEYMWFSGNYLLINSKGKQLTKIEFDDNGRVVSQRGTYTNYFLDTDAENKDFIALYNNQNEHEDIDDYLLMEYKNGDFYCYNCYNFNESDDWEVPFRKRDLRFILRKQ
jgi:hypothetical protein